MKLQYTLEQYALQLKNVPPTPVAVAGVVQEIMKALYETHFQMRSIADPVGTPIVPIPIFSPSGGCLNISVRTANIRGIGV